MARTNQQSGEHRIRIRVVLVEIEFTAQSGIEPVNQGPGLRKCGRSESTIVNAERWGANALRRAG
jgi:hypothetical protein